MIHAISTVRYQRTRIVLPRKECTCNTTHYNKLKTCEAFERCVADAPDKLETCSIFHKIYPCLVFIKFLLKFIETTFRRVDARIQSGRILANVYDDVLKATIVNHRHEPMSILVDTSIVVFCCTRTETK